MHLEVVDAEPPPFHTRQVRVRGPHALNDVRAAAPSTPAPCHVWIVRRSLAAELSVAVHLIDLRMWVREPGSIEETVNPLAHGLQAISMVSRACWCAWWFACIRSSFGAGNGTPYSLRRLRARRQ
jgi:hypothetical protein